MTHTGKNSQLKALLRLKPSRLRRLYIFFRNAWIRWSTPCFGKICKASWRSISIEEAELTCTQCGKRGIYHCGQVQTEEEAEMLAG